MKSRKQIIRDSYSTIMMITPKFNGIITPIKSQILDLIFKKSRINYILSIGKTL